MGAGTICSVTTAGGSAVRLMRYAADERHPLHAHDRSSITLILSGGLEERVGAHIERAAALSVVIKPAGTSHADRFGARGATTLQIELSPEDESGSSGAPGALGSWRWIHVPEAARPMLDMVNHLQGRAGRGSPGSGSPIEDLLFETLAAVDPPVDPPRSRPPGWLMRTRDALARRSIPIQKLSQEAGVHPIHLAREFRRHFGITPTHFRGRMRLWRAAGMLSRTAEPLASVALEVGFTDQAHMSRALRSATGQTPLTLRRLTRSATDAH